MSIDDRVLIETDKTFKEIAKLFLEKTGFLPEKLQFIEEENGTAIYSAHWNAWVGDYPFDRVVEYKEKLGIKPRVCIFITLNKEHIQEARIEILKIVLTLIQAGSLDLAWFHNHTFPKLVYRNSKYILKRDDSFWQKHLNMLPNSSIEYQDLPQF